MSYLATIKRWEVAGEAPRPTYEKSLSYEINEIDELRPKQIERRKPNTDVPNEINEINEKSLSQQKAVTETLLTRLQAGSHWLTAQHEAWLAGNVDAANDKRFSAALEAWDALERLLRTVFNFEGCIHGPSGRCPADAPVVCDFCLEVTKNE